MKPGERSAGAGQDGSPAFKFVDLQEDSARVDFERSFMLFLHPEHRNWQRLKDALANYRLWKDLNELRTLVAYYERHKGFPWSEGGPF